MRRKKNTVQLNHLNYVASDIPCLLRHCAGQLFAQAGVSCCDRLLTDLVCDAAYHSFCRKHAEIETITYPYLPGEDTLGQLYQSLCDIGNRKSSGSYYTPDSVATRLISVHLPEISPTQTFYDPSCGTGIFLLKLPDTLPLANLYGNDCNPLCITLTRINLALKYRVAHEAELEILFRNFTVSDFLSDENNIRKPPQSSGFDIILGNPPWGATLTAEQKKQYRNRFSCTTRHGTEIFDLFIEQSLPLLLENGTLSFVLPEALLSVKMHRPVRKLLLDSCTAVSVEYLGDVFKEVYCPSMILTLKKDTITSFYRDTTVYNRQRTYTISKERAKEDTCLSFALSDEEYTLLEKIRHTPGCTTLKGQADFALGIVTGNNAALLSKDFSEGLEPIIRGTDISKYHINSYSGYLQFQPEMFQQTAPEHLYRTGEKLFYRFINRQLIFAYDDTGLLSLNSCNIVIPRIHGLSMKYIMAILNSSVAQFVFEKQFASVKVLRSHLEEIPLPVADKKTQEQIVAMVDVLMTSDKESQEYQTTFLTLDQVIADLFKLNEEEYCILSKS